MTQTSSPIAPLSLVLAMLLWASSLIALKIAFIGYHPMQVIFGRMLIASLSFVPFARSFSRISWQRRDIGFLLLMALFEPCLYFLLEAAALKNTSASQAGMITAFLPMLVAIGAWLVLKEKIGRTTLTGFFIAICGAVLLSLAAENSTSAPAPLLGNLLELGAMACAAGYTICLKHLSGRYPPLLLTAVQAFVGAFFFAIFLAQPSVGLPLHWDNLSGLAIVYLGTFVTFGAYGLYNFGVSRIPASRAAAFVNLIPVFSIVLGYLLLGEELSRGQWLAALLVFLGVYLSQRGGKTLPKLMKPHPLESPTV